MADNVLALRSERFGDVVFLSKSKLNIDGPQADTWSLPPQFGDIAIMEVVVAVDNIDVLSTVANIGLLAMIINAAGDTFVDKVGVGTWRTHNSGTANDLGACCELIPDALVQMKQDERLYIEFGEIDTDATPTADLSVYVKAARLRPIQASEQPMPMRLVR